MKTAVNVSHTITVNLGAGEPLPPQVLTQLIAAAAMGIQEAAEQKGVDLLSVTIGVIVNRPETDQ